MNPAPNASGAVASLVLGILFLVAFFAFVAGVDDGTGGVTESVAP